MRSDSGREDDVQGDDQIWEEVVLGAVSALLALLLLPLWAAWFGASRAASQPLAWRIRRAVGVAPLALLFGAEGVVLWSGAGRWLFERLSPHGATAGLLALVVVWLLLVPVAGLLWSWRMSRLAGELARGEVAPSAADPMRQAMWRAADDLAMRRSGWRIRQERIELIDRDALPALIPVVGGGDHEQR